LERDDGTMALSENHEVAVAVSDLLHRLFFNLDERRYSQVAELFAPDGVWHRQGEQLQGGADVRRALERRPAQLRTRHLVSNTIIEAADGLTSESAHYVLVFAHHADEAMLRLPELQPLQLGVYRARCRHTDGKWEIVELTGQPSFRRVEAS